MKVFTKARKTTLSHTTSRSCIKSVTTKSLSKNNFKNHINNNNLKSGLKQRPTLLFSSQNFSLSKLTATRYFSNYKTNQKKADFFKNIHNKNNSTNLFNHKLQHQFQDRSFLLLKSKFENSALDPIQFIQTDDLLPELKDAERHIKNNKNLKEARLLIDRSLEILRPSFLPTSPLLHSIFSQQYLLNYQDRKFGLLEKTALNALNPLKEALEKKENEKIENFDFLYVNSLSKAILAYKFLHKYEEGLGFSHQLVDFFKNKGETHKSELGDSLLDLGNISYWKEEIYQSLDSTNSLFWQAYDVSDDNYIKAKAANNIGCIFLKNGELDKAEEKFKEALFLIDKTQKNDSKKDEKFSFFLEKDRIATELNIAETKMEGRDFGDQVQGHLELNFKDYVKLVGTENRETFYHVLFLVKMGKCFAEANVNLTADGCYSKAFSLMTEICRNSPLEEHLYTFEQICYEGAEISYKVGKEKGSKLGFAIAEGLKLLRTRRKQVEALKETKEKDVSNLSPEEKLELDREKSVESFANILTKYFAGELSDSDLRERATQMGSVYSEFDQIISKRDF